MPHIDDVRGVGFRKLTSVNRALSIFLRAFPPLSGEETIRTSESYGRVLSGDVTCLIDLPPYDKSAVDGYAVRFRDTRAASANSPVALRIVGESRLGRLPSFRVKSGTAARIATGAALPKGTDAVVMIENTRQRKNYVEIFEPLNALAEVIRRGEDMRKGSRLLERGKWIAAQDVAILSAAGVASVRVRRRPVIGVLSTGNELVDSRARLRPGRSFDSNRPALMAQVRELGAIAYDLGIVPDSKPRILQKLRHAIRRLDGIVITAGSSVGGRDIVPTAINSLGKPGMLVHGIAMRPAMPTGLAVVGGKPIASLPGFPTSALVSFMVFVEPAIYRLMRVVPQPRPTVSARLLGVVKGAKGMRTYVRVKLAKTRGSVVAQPLKYFGGSLLSSLVRADGIVTVPEKTSKLGKGRYVEVRLLRPITRA